MNPILPLAPAMEEDPNVLIAKDDGMEVEEDRLTKSAHFIPVNTAYHTGKYVELYVSQIMRLHGIPRTIISDQGPHFIARF